MPSKTRHTRKKIRNHIQDNDIAATLFQNNGLNIVNSKNTKKQVAEVGKLRQLHNYPSPIVVNLNNAAKNNKNLESIMQDIVQYKNIRQSYEEQLEIAEMKKLSRLAMNISHNLSTYINKTFFGYNGMRGVSNGYVKLWEIYQQFGKEIMKSVKSPATFQIGRAHV